MFFLIQYDKEYLHKLAPLIGIIIIYLIANEKMDYGSVTTFVRGLSSMAPALVNAYFAKNGPRIS